MNLRDLLKLVPREKKMIQLVQLTFFHRILEKLQYLCHLNNLVKTFSKDFYFQDLIASEMKKDIDINFISFPVSCGKTDEIFREANILSCSKLLD